MDGIEKLRATLCAIDREVVEGELPASSRKRISELCDRAHEHLDTLERPPLDERVIWCQFAAAALGGLCAFDEDEEVQSSTLSRYADGMLAEYKERYDKEGA